MKLFRNIAALILAMMLVFSVSALAEDASLTDLQARGKLVLGFDASFPPMGYQDDDGSYVGFDLDCAAEVCKLLNVELVLQPIDWAAKDLELNSGNIDCIWNGMTATEERAESMSLSLNYLNNAQVVCVLADSGIETLADMAGKTVAVQSGSAGVDAIEANPDFKASLAAAPVEYADYAMALMDLDNKGVDGVVIDIVVANYYIAQKGAAYKVLSEQLTPEYYAIGFRKTDVALTEAVNNALKEMVANGTLAEVSTKWFGEDITIVAEQ